MSPGVTTTGLLGHTNMRLTPCQCFLPGGSWVVVTWCRVLRGPLSGFAVPGDPICPPAGARGTASVTGTLTDGKGQHGPSTQLALRYLSTAGTARQGGLSLGEQVPWVPGML